MIIIAILPVLQPVAKMLRHSHEKMTFLAANRSGHRSVRYNTNLPPPSSLPFKVVPPSVEYGLQLLATLIRGGGGIQAQDHGQAIYANVWYSVSSTFTIGCSKKLFIRAETHEGLFNRFNPIFSWG